MSDKVVGLVSPAAQDHVVAPMHKDELHIDADLVRRLVARSFPDLADQPLQTTGETGSSNALYRLGDGLAVRLPRQS